MQTGEDSEIMSYMQNMAQVEGWLNDITAKMIYQLLRYQTEAGLRGNVLEIGVHHGRLFLLLALSVAREEHAVAVDLFGDQHLNVGRSGRGDRNIFEQNIRAYAPNARILILQANSTRLGEDFLELIME